jgi:hypothetical protein
MHGQIGERGREQADRTRLAELERGLGVAVDKGFLDRGLVGCVDFDDPR